MKVYIKNMVCDRCKMAVKTEFQKLGLSPTSVELGQVELQEPSISADTEKQLTVNLETLGFEVVNDEKAQLVLKIKSLIVSLVHYSAQPLSVNLSTYLSEKIDLNYAVLSNAFSEQTGSTIEKYFISQKIEKVKELLSYGEKSLSEIAFFLNYSSVAHLSAQFKKNTGQTPSAYKASHLKDRKTLDNI